MRARYTMLGLALAALLLPPAPRVASAEGGKKVALVIGNSAYATGALRNPANDASDMGSALRGLGFLVIPGIDADRKAMYALIERFGAETRDADIALFYYSGHGVQAGGENYLIPVRADISAASDVETEGVRLQRVISRMNDSGSATNILILDACRNNPFPSASRGMERGLAVVGAKPPESLIIYATEAGETADDGSGRNGTFTAALLKRIGERAELGTVLREVNADVRAATAQKQRPAKYDNLTREVYLAGMPAAAASAAQPAPRAPEPAASAASRPPAPPAWLPRPDDFVLVPGGGFTMGSPSSEQGRSDNETRRKVDLGAFWISKFPLTMDEFDAYCAAEGRPKPWPERFSRGRIPASDLSWFDALAYCNWRSAQEGYKPAYSVGGESDPAKWPSGWDSRPGGVACDFSASGYRLPTEAEWEYAAKGGPKADSLPAKAVFAGNSNIDEALIFSSVGAALPYGIGQRKANPLGLYDMVGNVAQWCWDWLGPYPKGREADPRGPGQGEEKVVRGGSGYAPAYLRSSFRSGKNPVFRIHTVGLRLARSAAR